MAEAARKDERSSSVQTYSRSVEEIAAKVARTRGTDPKLERELSRRISEQANELADFIIDQASKIKKAAGQ